MKQTCRARTTALWAWPIASRAAGAPNPCWAGGQRSPSKTACGGWSGTLSGGSSTAMRPRPDSLRILTNFDRFPADWTVSAGERGTARVVHTYDEFLPLLPQSDLVLVNCDVDLAFRLCTRGSLLPWKHRTLVAVDLVLGYPETAAARMACMLKKGLLRRVDHFINYFRQSEGYAKYYGITPARSSFIHFKPNLRYRFDTPADPDGEYVLCFGRSRRDY